MAQPYYQPVLDAIKTHPDEWLEMVLKLCEAVEAEDGPKIVLLTRPLVTKVAPRMPPIEDLPPEVFYETMARLLFMGEHQDLQLLVEWYERLISFARGRKQKIAENWVGIFEFVTLPPANLPEKELDRQRTRITTALRGVLPTYVSAVTEAGPPPTYFPVPGELPPGSFGTARSRPTLVQTLADGILKLVWAWMAVHQQFLDAALQHLGSNVKDRGEKLLSLRTRWLQALSLTFGHHRYNKSMPLAQLEIELARIQYGRSPKHRYLDAFLPHEARQFGFTPYDREPEDEPSGKSIWLADLFQHRGSQLHFLLDEYGEYYTDESASPRTAAGIHEERHRKQTYTARRKLIDQVEKRARSLRLESEDDLVSFGCAFYQALLGATAQPSPYEAWDLLLKFVDRYLKALTTHTEFNLDEEPSYFDRLFPRAINGAALHDCGVYAVRLAFLFLSLADCVKGAYAETKPPRVSFLMLPLHVGLIVEIDGFLPFVTHNQVMFRPTYEQISEWRKEWDASPESRDPKDSEMRDQKFLEDIATQMFLRDVDSPLLRLPIAPVSAPPKKPEIWKAFRRLVVPKIDKLFSPLVGNPGRDEYQFDLRFLTVRTLEKRWHDATVVPFWNGGCFGLWNRTDARDNRVFTVASLKQNAAKRKEYADALEALVTAVEATYDKQIRSKKNELTKEFRAHPDALGSEAQRITTASRLKNAASALGPVGQVREHLAEIRKGNVSVPPFATEADKLTRWGD